MPILEESTSQVRYHDAAQFVTGHEAGHFAIILGDDHGHRMYWTGRGFRVFDDDGKPCTDVRLWRNPDAIKAYGKALDAARQNAAYAEAFLQLIPFALTPFETR